MASHVFFQGMTQRDITAHFRNLKKCGLPNFTLDSFKELRQTLKKDRMSVTVAFRSHLISAEFEGQRIQHHVYIRDPIDIMKEVIRDDSTRQHMQFYPVKKFKRTDEQPSRDVRVYDEVWTTKRWWETAVKGAEVVNTQDSLPNHDGCVGAIILYSDGTSAFILSICGSGMFLCENGAEIEKEGASSSDFSPKDQIPATDQQKKNKKFRLYRRSVYHKVIGLVLKQIRRYEQVGFRVRVGTEFDKLIFPRLFLLQADLAELYIILLLLGVNSEFKCPICLVPQAYLHWLTKQFPKRSLEQAQRQLQQYQRTQDTKGTGVAVKELTSVSSLRPEKSAFRRLKCSDVYESIAADSLLVFGGLYKDHVMQKLFDNLSTAKKEQVDSYLISLPSYGSLRHVPKRGLTNLESFTCMEIQDAMKCLIVGLIGLLPAEIEQEVIPALRALAAFEVLVKMHVQDDDRISILRNHHLQRFEAALKTLHKHFGMSDKFPKSHLPQHFVDMISEGGTLDHQTTAHSERAHHPLKEHVIARAIRSTVDGETGESMAQHAFEMMQIQTIERRIDAVNALQLNCGKEDRSRTPIQNGTPNFRLCGLSKRFPSNSIIDKTSLMTSDSSSYEPSNPSTPIRVRQEHLPQIDESTLSDYGLYTLSLLI
ncbi:hypothetical protein BT69DRAFT_1302971 [Atractiella rhizophila]|nr:hypothetical protein BT69DRAFT_1302971 [Atractiella rhizophila]